MAYNRSFFSRNTALVTNSTNPAGQHQAQVSSNPTWQGLLLQSSIFLVFKHRVATTLLDYSQLWKQKSLCERLFSRVFFKSWLEARCTGSQGWLLWFLVQSHRFKPVWIIQWCLVHHTWVLILWEYESFFIHSLLLHWCTFSEHN